MRNLFSFALLLFMSAFAFGQVPQGINYQAVIRGLDGYGLKNQFVAVQISIHKGSVGGTFSQLMYAERFETTTNDVGLVNLVIGTGKAESGVFKDISWNTGEHFIRVSVDPKGGTSYVQMGVQQIMSVPYAMYAEKTKMLLVSTAVESAGINCPTGGNRYDFGFDNNLNGLLDATEIDTKLTRYTCNGAAGPVGPSGAKILTGTTAPTSTTGANGDYYFNTTSKLLIGPKASGSWPTAGTTLKGDAGSRILSGSSAPTSTTGVDGDYFFNTSTKTMIGPKASGAWPTAGTALAGPQGPQGLTGTSLLNGTSNPTSTQGNNGDFFLNTTSRTLFGPKASGAWPTSGVSLVGPTGATGATGTAGSKILSGTTAPTSTTGVTGDYYFNTATKTLFGPKSSTSWPTSGTLLTGLQGAPGSSILNGTSNPSSTQGNNGDFFINTSTKTMFGPKANGAWPTAGFSLVGPTGLTGPAGPTGPTGPAGKSILTGTTAPGSSAGNIGDLYLNTATNTLFGPKTSATAWPTTGVSLIGQAGKSILSGATTPTNTLGNNGDLYINTTDKKLYGPKANGIWPNTGTALLGVITIGGKISPVIDTLKYPNGGAQLKIYTPGPGGGGSADTVEIDGAIFPNNTLTKTTTFPFSAQCRYGGTKIESGVDTNRNGVLDASEVTSTQIICNGTSDIQLKSISSTNTNYPNGGAQLMMFMPGPGGGGSADTVEVDGAVFPNNTLTKTTAIPFSAQCRYGGTKIESGVDINRNGVLDANEVTSTQIICNGTSNIQLKPISEWWSSIDDVHAWSWWWWFSGYS